MLKERNTGKIHRYTSVHHSQRHRLSGEISEWYYQSDNIKHINVFELIKTHRLSNMRFAFRNAMLSLSLSLSLSPHLLPPRSRTGLAGFQSLFLLLAMQKSCYSVLKTIKIHYILPTDYYRRTYRKSVRLQSVSHINNV